MEIKIYTTSGCSSCTHLITLLKKANVEWEEVRINRDITMNEFRSKFPTIIGTPFIIIDGEEYLGVHEVARYFLKQGIVKVPEFVVEKIKSDMKLELNKEN